MRGTSKFLILSWLITLACPMTSEGQKQWRLVKAASSVQFQIEHLFVSTVSGVFTSFEVTFTSNSDLVLNVMVEAEIEVKSVDTGSSMRDKQLMEEGFFDAVTFPKITFQSIAFQHLRNNQYALSGFLTMKGVKKLVKLSVDVNVDEDKTEFTATTSINRKDYNINAGGSTVGESVDIVCHAVFVAKTE